MEIVTKARNMVHKLENHIDSRFRLGIGGIRSLDGKEIKESYGEALCALREGSGHTVHIEDIPAVQKYDGEYPRELENRYFQRAMEKDVAGTVSCARQLFLWMLKHPGCSREEVEIKVLELTISLEKKAFQAGGVRYGFGYRSNYIREIQSCADYEALLKWFITKVKQVCANMENAKEKETLSVVEKARTYIRENFHKEISLDDVSREFDISPYYFSKLFKQETGKNFVEYLTEVRLKNARELLCNSKASIKEICVASGYSDPNYFSRILRNTKE